MSPQAARINASIARRGAALIRETAYQAVVLDIANGDATYAQCVGLFEARHRFTPGWSSRAMVAQGSTVIREAVRASGDALEAGREVAAVLQATGHWTDR